MPATKADIDRLDAILDRLDDYTAASGVDPELAAIADDLTGWYGRMFRPAPPAPLALGPGVTPAGWQDLGRLVGCIRRAAHRLAARLSYDPLAGHLLALAEDARGVVADAWPGRDAPAGP